LVLQRRGAVFMACHNAIWEHAERLRNAEQNPDHLAVEAIAAELTNHLIPNVVLTDPRHRRYISEAPAIRVRICKVKPISPQLQPAWQCDFSSGAGAAIFYRRPQPKKTNHGRYDDPSPFVAVRPRPRACSSDAHGMTSIPPCINDRLRQPHRIGKTELVAAGDLYEPEQPQFLR